MTTPPPSHPAPENAVSAVHETFTCAAYLDDTAHSTLKEAIYAWVCANPGNDAEDVSKRFGISGLKACALTGELMADGRLEEFTP